MYAWEPSFSEKILTIRAQEIMLLRRISYIDTAISFTWMTAPIMVSVEDFRTLSPIYAKLSAVPLDLFFNVSDFHDHVRHVHPLGRKKRTHDRDCPRVFIAVQYHEDTDCFDTEICEQFNASELTSLRYVCKSLLCQRLD